MAWCKAESIGISLGRQNDKSEGLNWPQVRTSMIDYGSFGWPGGKGKGATLNVDRDTAAIAQVAAAKMNSLILAGILFQTQGHYYSGSKHAI